MGEPWAVDYARAMGFLFVHGGAHGAWCWERVLPHLESPARAMDLPGRGTRPANLDSVKLDDWVDAVVDEIMQSGDESTVLVGHSLAGITLPRVAERISERLAHLIFVACTVPEEGRAVLEDLAPDVELLAKQNLEHPVAMTLPDEIATQMFCNDMNAEQTRFVLDHLVPEAWLPMQTPNRLAGLKRGVPATYVKLLQDQSLPPELQDQMIRNIGTPRVVVMDAGHNVMISQPEALANLLNELVVDN